MKVITDNLLTSFFIIIIIFFIIYNDYWYWGKVSSINWLQRTNIYDSIQIANPNHTQTKLYYKIYRIQKITFVSSHNLYCKVWEESIKNGLVCHIKEYNNKIRES